MKRILGLFAVLMLVSAHAFATYIVVLKDGTKYTAKEKFTAQGNKARITLQNGQVLLINLSDIDVAKSEQITKLGLGQVNVIPESQIPSPTANTQQQPSLGSQIKLRPRGGFNDNGAQQTAPPPPPTTKAAPPANTPVVTAPIADELDGRLKDNFERAYENVGIYEHKMSGTNRTVRAELTADNEDKVFNALSATAFLIVRNAGLDNVTIDVVEIFMKTTNGGAAGRFQMSRADAEAINTKAITMPDYFVRKVIY